MRTTTQDLLLRKMPRQGVVLGHGQVTAVSDDYATVSWLSTELYVPFTGTVEPGQLVWLLQQGSTVVALGAGGNGGGGTAPSIAVGIMNRTGTGDFPNNTIATLGYHEITHLEDPDGALTGFPGGGAYWQVNQDGWYLAVASMVWTANATGSRRIAFEVNDTVSLADRMQMVAPVGGRNAEQQIIRMFRLTAGDTIRVRPWQDSGGALQAAAQGRFQISRIVAAGSTGGGGSGGGLPEGGNPGDLLTKVTTTDFDVQWAPPLPSGAPLVFTGFWWYDTTTAAPTAGQVNYDQTAAVIRLSELDDLGLDRSTALDLVDTPATVLLRSTTGAWATFTATAIADQGTYRAITVTPADSGGTLTPAQRVEVAWYFGIGQGGGGGGGEFLPLTGGSLIGPLRLAGDQFDPLYLQRASSSHDWQISHWAAGYMGFRWALSGTTDYAINATFGPNIPRAGGANMALHGIESATAANMALIPHTGNVFWVHAANDQFYVLYDHGNTGAWSAPHPFQISVAGEWARLFGDDIATQPWVAAGYSAQGHGHSAYSPTGHTHNYSPTGHTHNYLPLSGGTLNGSLNMSGNTITNLPDPTGSAQPVTLGYANDNLLSQRASASLAARTAPDNFHTAGAFWIDGTAWYWTNTYKNTSSTYPTIRMLDDRLYEHASTRRLKRNIRSLDPKIALAKLLRLDPVSFIAIDSENKEWGLSLGLIAEDVIKEYPELVGLDRDQRPNSVSYDVLTAPIVAAIQALNRRIVALEKRRPDDR